MIINGAKYLLITDEPFYAANGLAYRAIWGRCWVKSFQDTFKFPAKHHVNWYISVSENEEDTDGYLIAGCRINYAKRTDEPPQVLRTNMVMMLGVDNIPFPYYYTNIFIP